MRPQSVLRSRSCTLSCPGRRVLASGGKSGLTNTVDKLVSPFAMNIASPKRTRPAPETERRKPIMKTFSKAMLRRLIVAPLLVIGSALYSQTSPKDFIAEPDKTMAVAREYFLKGDRSKATAEIRKVALFLKKDSVEVVTECKTNLEDAARELEKLGEDLKKGVAKSDAELSRVFARTDYALATSWNRTAAQSGKADREEALKRAGSALLGAAKWSASKLHGGADSPLKAFAEPDQTAGTDIRPGIQKIDGSKVSSESSPDEGRKP